MSMMVPVAAWSREGSMGVWNVHFAAVGALQR